MTGFKQYDISEIERHKTAKDCWVYNENGQVFDVSNFVSDHPGGEGILLKYGGKNVTSFMQNEMIHKHSEFAYEILNDYQIGVMKNKDMSIELEEFPDEEPRETDIDQDYKNHRFLDLRKPLLKQLLLTKISKDFYLQQVHLPRHHPKGSALIFGNFLEPLSKTKWYVIPTLWLPFVAFGVSVARKGLSDFVTGLLLVAGLAIWTLVEYGMHRFLFHVDKFLPDHPYFLTLHFLLHGVHHYLPMDQERLVMPPALFVCLAWPWWRLVKLLFPFHVGVAIYCGAILGYVMYDCTHYFIHHKRLKSAYLQSMKKYHLDHHYKNYKSGFGVTSKFWDNIWGTRITLSN